MTYTIGDLAQRTGLTVRTLHHYEQLGLLLPSARTDGGYRLYGDADVQRLHRILAYRQIGLPLKEIAPLLAPDAVVPLAELLDRQIATIEAAIAAQQQLLSTLRRVSRRAGEGDAPGTEELLRLIHAQRVFERHYSAEEIDQIHTLREALAPADLQRFKHDVPRLLKTFREGLKADVAPDAPSMRKAALEWAALEALVPVDEEIRRKGRQMVEADTGFQQLSGMDAALARFIDAAVAAVKPDAER